MKLAVLPNLTKKNAREIALSVLREGKALGIQCVMCDSLKADFIQRGFFFSPRAGGAAIRRFCGFYWRRRHYDPRCQARGALA